MLTVCYGWVSVFGRVVYGPVTVTGLNGNGQKETVCGWPADCGCLQCVAGNDGKVAGQC